MKYISMALVLLLEYAKIQQLKIWHILSTALTKKEKKNRKDKTTS